LCEKSNIEVKTGQASIGVKEDSVSGLILEEGPSLGLGRLVIKRRTGRGWGDKRRRIMRKTGRSDIAL